MMMGMNAPIIIADVTIANQIKIYDMIRSQFVVGTVFCGTIYFNHLLQINTAFHTLNRINIGWLNCRFLWFFDILLASDDIGSDWLWWWVIGVGLDIIFPFTASILVVIYFILMMVGIVDEKLTFFVDVIVW